MPRPERSLDRRPVPLPRFPLTRRRLLQAAAASALPLRLALPQPALAEALAEAPPEPVHALAMHGLPKYPAGFDRFAYTDPAAVRGGQAVQSALGSFDSLNPWIVGGVVPELLDVWCSARLGLRGWDEPFTLYGYLAERFVMPPARDWLVIHLRPEARFDDGTPIDADTVLWSWQTLRDKGRPNHRSYYSRVAEAVKLSPAQLRFTFQPLPDGTMDRELPLILCLMPILPRHWFETRRFDRTTLEVPPSSGPYRVAALDPGRSVTYARVETWWGDALPATRGLYNVGRLRLDYYRNENAALLAFNAGRIAWRRESDVRRWQSEYNAKAVEDGRLTLGEYAHSRPDPARFFVFNTRRPIFADRRVRLALMHAFDAGWVNSSLYRGALKRVASMFPNSELAAQGLPEGRELALLEPFRDRLPPELFQQPVPVPDNAQSGPAGMRDNLRAAETLLAEAGCRLDGGQRVLPDGTPLRFTMLLQDPDDEKIALQFARGLERLGVTAGVQTVDSAQYALRRNGFDYDMLAWAWISTLSPGNEQRTYWSSAAADSNGSRNYAGVRDPTVDALAAALGAVETREDLVAAVRAMDRVLMWGCYGLPLFYSGVDRVASWERVHQPQTDSRYGAILESWWLKDPARSP